MPGLEPGIQAAPSVIRRRPKTTASCCVHRRDPVIPFWMERVTSYVEARHFRIEDLYALGISVAIEFATDRKPFFCRGVGDQRDCDVEADERHGAPVLGDEAKHPMLDLVPLGSARRIVANLNDQAGFVGELLQRPLPEPQT